MRTRAKKTKDGYVLNGSKMWITNSPIADIAIVWAKAVTAGTHPLHCAVGGGAVLVVVALLSNAIFDRPLSVDRVARDCERVVRR